MREAWLIVGAVAFLYAVGAVYFWAWDNIPLFDAVASIAFFTGAFALMFVAINRKGN
jgi:hypothetical protein